MYVSCVGPAEHHPTLSLKGEPPEERGAANPGLWRLNRWPIEEATTASLAAYLGKLTVRSFVDLLTFRAASSGAPFIGTRTHAGSRRCTGLRRIVLGKTAPIILGLRFWHLSLGDCL